MIQTSTTTNIIRNTFYKNQEQVLSSASFAVTDESPCSSSSCFTFPEEPSATATTSSSLPLLSNNLTGSASTLYTTNTTKHDHNGNDYDNATVSCSSDSEDDATKKRVSDGEEDSKPPSYGEEDSNPPAKKAGPNDDWMTMAARLRGRVRVRASAR